MQKDPVLPYPYFLLGFEFNLSDLDAEQFTSNLMDLSFFRRFSFEEASKVVSESEVVRSIQIICGDPRQVVKDEPLTVCEYTPILLTTFIECKGIVLPEADLMDIPNIKVYLNGKIAEYKEDYELNGLENKISILWDDIKSTDLISYSIPFKLKVRP